MDEHHGNSAMTRSNKCIVSYKTNCLLPFLDTLSRNEERQKEGYREWKYARHFQGRHGTANRRHIPSIPGGEYATV